MNLFGAFQNALLLNRPASAQGKINIMDMRGVLLSTIILAEKQTTVSYNGRGLAAGIYFASLVLVDQFGQPHTLKIIKY